MYRNYRPFPAFRLVGKLLLDSATFTGENPGTGYGLDDPTTFLKCDLTPWGFHAMVVSSAGGTYFIDPYSLGDRVHYVVYFKKDYPRPAGKTFVWATAAETNNRGFEIEMKPETDANFQTVGFVAGKGTATDQNNYRFQVDNLAGGTWYFRLKQLDAAWKSCSKWNCSPIPCNTS